MLSNGSTSESEPPGRFHRPEQSGSVRQTTSERRDPAGSSNSTPESSEDFSLGGLKELLEWFASFDGDRDRQQKAQRIAGSTLFILFLCAVFVTSDLFREIPALLPLGLGSGMLLGGAVLTILKTTGSTRWAGHVLCTSYLLILAQQCLTDTGLTNPAAVVTLLTPWLAVICLNRKAASFYAGLATLLYIGLYTLNAQGYDFYFTASEADVHIHLVMILVIMVWVVAAIGYTYEKQRERARAARRPGTQGALQPEVLSYLTRDLRPLVLDTVGLGASLCSGKDLGDGRSPNDGDTSTIRHGSLIEENGRQLLEMLNTADELVELERSKREPTLENVEVPAEIERALSSLHPMAEKQDVALWIESSGTSGRTIYTDRQLIGRLTTLLVKSSIANLRSGQVTVRFDFEDRHTRLCVEAEGQYKTGSLSQDHAEAPLASHIDFATASRIAEKLDGRLDVDYSSPGRPCSVLIPNSRG